MNAYKEVALFQFTPAIRRYIAFGGFIFSLGYSYAAAACSMTISPASTQTVSLGDIRASTSLAIGSVIATYQSTSFSYVSIAASLSASRLCQISVMTILKKYGIPISSASGWPLSNNIMATPIAGLGIRVSLLTSDGDIYAGTSYIPSFTTAFNGIPAGSWKVEAIKTGTLDSGSLPAGTTLAKMTIIDPDNISHTLLTLNLAGGSSVASSTCTLSSTSISVPIGNIAGTKFSKIGSTAGDKSFDIGLKCDKNANINVSMTGTQNKDTAEKSVLALTTGGNAQGIGVQLLYGGTPLTLGSNLALKTASSGGAETLPFTARYYQTQSTVIAGTANATATLTFTYP
ncbi:Type-1A pilin [Serratia quinivorans]|nr:Type-1A pilin [Serratia quinivorans]CAI1666477.1 Type-1A pilin [Serratia quinivorans]